MSPLLAKVVCLGLAAVMGLAIANLSVFTSLYLAVRPLVQPFAFLKYDLVSGVPLTTLFSMLVMGAFLVKSMTSSNFRIFPPGMPTLFLILVAVVISMFGTLHFKMSVSGMLKLMTSFIFYAVAYNSIHSERDTKRVLLAILIGTLLPMVFGYYQYVTETGHAWKSDFYASDRIDSTLGEYNAYGQFLGLAMIAGLMLFIRFKSMRRPWLLLIMASLGVSFVLSLNRGCWIGLALGVALSSVLFISRISLKRLVLLGLVAAIAAGPVIHSRFKQLDEAEGLQKDTFESRVHYWEESLPFIAERPLLGFGVKTYSLLSEQRLGVERELHNDFMTLAVEAGLPALFLYIIFLASIVFYAFGYQRRTGAWHVNYPMLIALVFFVTTSQIQNNLYNQVNLPMFMTLLAVFHRENEMALHDPKPAKAVPAGAEPAGDPA
jgi:O-antigen ligase